MLHTCQGCGEAWSGQFIAANRGSFEVDAESKAVLHCPNCRISDGEVEDVAYEGDHITEIERRR